MSLRLASIVPQLFVFSVLLEHFYAIRLWMRFYHLALWFSFGDFRYNRKYESDTVP